MQTNDIKDNKASELFRQYQEIVNNIPVGISEKERVQLYERALPILNNIIEIVVPGATRLYLGVIYWQRGCLNKYLNKLADAVPDFKESHRYAKTRGDFLLEQDCERELRDIAPRIAKWGAEHIHEACDKGNYTEVKKLLDLGINPNLPTIYSSLAIATASMRGHSAIVELLIERAANVNNKELFGINALGLAAYGCEDVVRILLQNGADVNAVTDEGRTPLHGAAKVGSKIIAELLIAHGAQINVKDNKGFTALSQACASYNNEVADLLRKNGATE